jgi:hypothetical protein
MIKTTVTMGNRWGSGRKIEEEGLRGDAGPSRRIELSWCQSRALAMKED